MNGNNYVNGVFIPNRKEFSNINPATEESLGEFQNSRYEEVNDAVKSAKNVFAEWRKVSRVKRAEYFDNMCGLLKARFDSLVQCISNETGKTLNESVAEVNETLHMLQYTFSKGRMPNGEIIPSEIAEKDSYVIRKPKGVVGVIAPWNFCCAIGAAWCAAPAILEGNTVVLKPSEDAPAASEMMAELYHDAGFPKGVFNLVHGDGFTGHFLSAHKDINHICFTGSVAVGQFIKEDAVATGKTCSCEMGSKSAVIVFSDADMDLAVNACVISAYKLSGQRCVSSGRLLIERSGVQEFIERFVEASKNIKVGAFDEPDVFMGPLISSTQLKKVEDYNRSTEGNADILLKGERLNRKGYFLTPHVYTCEWSDLPFLHQEVFGPHVAIIPFDSLEEAVEIYNDTEFGLSCAVCTNDYRKMRYVRDNCDFGLGYANLPGVGAESQQIFGGVKASGYGWPSAAGTFDAVVHKVAWTVNHDEKGFQMAQGLK